METGLSDHHRLIYTMVKTQYTKPPPIEIVYRNYNNFKESSFLTDLHYFLKYGINFYHNFEKIFVDVLNKHAPRKTKFLRDNHKPHLTKELRKAITKRTEFCKKNKVSRRYGKL